MSLKLEKIAAEREKARRKRDEWEERRNCLLYTSDAADE